MPDSTPLQDAAASLHEAYLCFLAAGFDEKQAIYLTGQMLIGGAANHA